MLGVVHLQDRARLPGEVHQLRGARLHAVGHFEGADPGGDLRVADRVQPLLVQVADRRQRVALDLFVDALRVPQVEDRLAGVVELHPLVHRGEEARAPVGGAAGGAVRPGVEDHEGGEVARFAPQAVRHPRSHARPAELRRAGVHEDLRRGVVEGIGVHGLQDRDVVGDAGEVREQLRELRPALSMAGELELGAEEGRVRVDEGRAVNSEGRFQFQALTAGTYRVTAQKPGGEPGSNVSIDVTVDAGFREEIELPFE